MKDLSRREFFILLPLAFLTILLGLFPNIVLDAIHFTVSTLIIDNSSISSLHSSSQILNSPISTHLSTTELIVNSPIEDNSGDNSPSFLDTPISFEITPRQIGGLFGKLATASATSYAIYYGIKTATWVGESLPGTPLTKGVFIITGAITGGMFGMGIYAIVRNQASQGPFVNINIGRTNSNDVGIQTSDNLIESNVIKDENIPDINAPFEFFFSLSEFHFYKLFLNFILKL